MELLPAIDLRHGRVVRLVRGEDGERRTYDVEPLETLLRYAEAVQPECRNTPWSRSSAATTRLR